MQWPVFMWSSTLHYMESSLEKWVAWPALLLREGEGSSAVRNGEGYCLSWVFLMNSQKNPQNPTMRSIRHGLHQPSPHTVLLLRALLPSVKAGSWSRHSPATTRGRLPLESTAVVLQNPTVPSEDASSGNWSLVYYQRIAFYRSRAQERKLILGKKIYFRSTWQFCSALWQFCSLQDSSKLQKWRIIWDRSWSADVNLKHTGTCSCIELNNGD